MVMKNYQIERKAVNFMIQGINSDYDSYFSATSVATNSIAKTSESGNEKQADSSQTAKTDTVEISAQARAAMQQANSIVSVGGKTTADSSENEQKSADVTQASATKKPAATASTSTSTTQVTNLSGLSEAELDKLVSAGTITKSEKQQELVKRAAEKLEQDAAQNQKTQLTENPMEIL